MTAKDLLENQLDDARFQLEKCFEGLAEEHFSSRLTPEGKSPAEALEHLAEAYEAMIAEIEGRKHEWGSFSVADQSSTGLLKAWAEGRARTVSAVLASDNDAIYKHANDFLIGHDYYHVGQLCALRLHVDPSFNAYSIYRS